MIQVVQGRLSKQIAHDLGISEATVKVHRSAAKPKFTALNRQANGLDWRHRLAFRAIITQVGWAAMNTNAHSEPVLWRKSSLPHHATSWTSVSADAAIEFGRFRVLLRRRQLLADGVSVELGTRAFDLLLVLLEADGALVTKEELLNEVWSGIVVSEENLKVQISVLRKTLGTDRDLIRTEFGRGYRFIGMLRSKTTLHACRDLRRAKPRSVKPCFRRNVGNRSSVGFNFSC